MVPSFTGSIEVDVPVPCTYDLEIAATSYFHALDEGDIPLVLLFSGTVFTKGEQRIQRRSGAVAQGGRRTGCRSANGAR